MPVNIRPADHDDLEQMADVLMADAMQRNASDPVLWKLDNAACEKILSTLATTLGAENPPFRQQWLVAEANDTIVGATHSILLPVPPIYAGKFGPPGLIMEDCYVTPSADPGTQAALLAAAEADLIKAGAQVLLASSVQDGPWEGAYAQQGYQPLTMYFAKTGLSHSRAFTDVRSATETDIPAIVASSATNRAVLHALHPIFWEPHADADKRFGAWMQRSLTLSDRDMFVSDVDGAVTGYAISHPATPLHFPTPHDISNIGVIDDFFHDALKDPNASLQTAQQAAAVFEAAEAARGHRGDTSVLVVCPAAWHSKIAMLEQSGYRNAITWHIKMAV